MADPDGSWIALTYHHVNTFEQLVEVYVVLLIATKVRRIEVYDVLWALGTIEATRVWCQCDIWTQAGVTQQYVRPPA